METVPGLGPAGSVAVGNSRAAPPTQEVATAKGSGQGSGDQIGGVAVWASLERRSAS
jgi:hypothetical protein